MKGAVTLLLFALFIGVPALFLATWLMRAQADLSAAQPATASVPLAAPAEDAYCSADLKKVLRRVAGACGLLENGSRGCKPAEAKNLAALTGDEFNQLFKPLSKRARIIQFDADHVELDDRGKKLVESAWSEQRGASFFFIVARASTDGDPENNLRLSHDRAESVLGHIEQKTQDPDTKKEVGLLWLGDEYAQLSNEFCAWSRSREGECTEKDINRSAFIAWIDCQI
jgi:outer membrane protein OmpA-like peptidoglycan-associated protein